MVPSSRRGRGWKSAGVLALGALALAGAARADPQVYVGEVVTDVQLAGTYYHNAEVTLTFVGDTKDIAVVTDPSTGQPVASGRCPNGYQNTGQPVFFWLPKGNARIAIRQHGKEVTAKLLPGQVFVSVDRCSGGIGFGSLPSAGGFEPGYPLAFTNGDARVDAYCAGNSCLTGTVYGSGSVYSCVGYPANCADPNPLQTDAGVLLFYTPYQDFYSSNWPRYGSLNRGFFSMYPGDSSD